MIAPRVALELTIRLKPDSALGVRLATSMMQSRTTLIASNCFRERDVVVYRFICEKPEEAAFWLREEGFVAERNAVVLVDLGDEIRASQRLVRLLTATQITVLYVYSSITAHGQTVAVFKTNHDAEALRLIQNHSFTRPALAGSADNGHSPNQRLFTKAQPRAAC